jgi:hypothetical protein
MRLRAEALRHSLVKLLTGPGDICIVPVDQQLAPDKPLPTLPAWRSALLRPTMERHGVAHESGIGSFADSPDSMMSAQKMRRAQSVRQLVAKFGDA